MPRRTGQLGGRRALGPALLGTLGPPLRYTSPATSPAASNVGDPHVLSWPATTPRQSRMEGHMNRDFIGALLQLNAEKGVPREQLVHTVEDAIQSAYRRVAPGYEDVHVALDGRHRRDARLPCAASSWPRSRIAPPSGASTRPTQHEPDAALGDLVEYRGARPGALRARRRPDRRTGRPPAAARGRARERSSTSSPTATRRSSPAP